MTREATDDLVARVRELIREREARPGERIGNERELADSLNVPRTALRRALDVLEDEDAVRRVMGRTGGVFASDGKIERQINTTAGIPAMLRQQGIATHTDVVRVDLSAASPAEARALDLGSSSAVVRVVRRRSAAGAPWSLDTSVLPAALVPGIIAWDLSGSLYELLEREYGLVAAEADETIDVVPAGTDAASRLDVAEGDPLLQVWRVARTVTGVPFEFAHDFFRADRTRVHLRRFGSRWKRATPSENPG